MRSFVQVPRVVSYRLAVVGAVVVSCLALVSERGLSAQAEQTLRSRIEDHLRAYLVIADCSVSLIPCFQLSYVAERKPPSVMCESHNRVADLPYRAPEIDDAVFEVMNGEMQVGLRLYVAMYALEFLARRGVDTYCSPGAEARFHEFSSRVPFIWEGLIERVAARIGCEDCGASPEVPVVSGAQIRAVLDVLREGILSPGGNLWLGLPALRSVPECDPNLAVAIARVQRGWGDVPTAEAVEEELRRMGVSLIP